MQTPDVQYDVALIDGRKRGTTRSAGTLASLMAPVLIVDSHFEHSRVVARAARSICHEIAVLDTCKEAKAWLGCARFHYIIICTADGDRSYVELVEYIGSLGYRLPVVLIGEKDPQQRGIMRDMASDLRMTFYTFPDPVELGVLRVLLADQRAKTAGLPAAHMWGGVKVETVVARHRSKCSVKPPGRRANTH